mmetsp:Transcript_11869/g.10743  ORF Transcript_11869/g.10743 Transcript_11869/m.10743 type:complete len:350 (+) Transcript_11869:163-1212(+)
MDLILPWTDVSAIFTERYQVVYGESSKKAHIDCFDDDRRTIDGARLKWCSVLMLDAILFYSLSVRAFKAPVTSKRSFNQHKVLIECINEALRKHSKNNDFSSYTQIIISFDENKMWTSFENFFETQVSSPPRKAKEKFEIVLSHLCSLKNNYPDLKNYDLDVLILEMVNDVANTSLKSNSKRAKSNSSKQVSSYPNPTVSVLNIPEEYLDCILGFDFSFDAAETEYLKSPTISDISVSDRSSQSALYMNNLHLNLSSVSTDSNSVCNSENSLATSSPAVSLSPINISEVNRGFFSSSISYDRFENSYRANLQQLQNESVYKSVYPKRSRDYRSARERADCLREKVRESY